MKIERLPLTGLTRITPTRLGDHRGYFSEIFKEEWFRKNVAEVAFVQENESLSAKVGTVRGLHFQVDPFAQGKLVRCIAGKIFDVAVDIRVGSPSYGQWFGLELSVENGEQLWIPAGFAHGFATLVPNCVISYKVTAPYSAVSDRGLLWNDPRIGITWPLPLEDAFLSDKDKLQPTLANLLPSFKFNN
jgi:dTDP-4-dehydrorhamnose 3,5-epimerase